MSKDQSIIDPENLISRYHEGCPDPGNASEMVVFGTSGHRGTPRLNTFTEQHVLAICQAIAECRKRWGINGPLFLGMDTHALSPAVQYTALEVLVANNVEVVMQAEGGFTPTPSVSLAIIRHNKNSANRKADGVIITPSHNPPEDAGIKYNPPHGGPAESAVTKAIQDRANEILRDRNAGVLRRSVKDPSQDNQVTTIDLCGPYVDELPTVIDMQKVSSSGLRIGVHPLGGAALSYWDRIASRFNLQLTIVDRTIDPTFKFMSRDHDGKIRMDCSSPDAMIPLIAVKESFDLSFGNDPDADRHGIVVPGMGLIGANFFLAAAIDYLLGHRPDWSGSSKIGKTAVSSRLIDRVVERHRRQLFEVPVGFKWFAGGLSDGSVCFGGEESAGASFLRLDGSPWSTDKDGIVMCLLAAEMCAAVGDLKSYIDNLYAVHGKVFYSRSDVPFSLDLRSKLLDRLVPNVWESHKTLGGDQIQAVLEKAPGNGEPLGGIRIVTSEGWVAGRPSGTEPIFKIYSESDVSEAHRSQLVGDFKSGLGLE